MTERPDMSRASVFGYYAGGSAIARGSTLTQENTARALENARMALAEIRRARGLTQEEVVFLEGRCAEIELLLMPEQERLIARLGVPVWGRRRRSDVVQARRSCRL